MYDSYSEHITLHDTELIVDYTVVKGDDGDYFTPGIPDEILIDYVYVGNHDITILIEEGGMLNDVKRIISEKYYS